MAKKDQAKQALSQWAKKFQPKKHYRTAYLGDGKGKERHNLFVDEDSNNPSQKSLVWVRYNLEDSGGFAVMNKTVNPVFDLPIFIGEKNEEPGINQVIAVDHAALTQDGTQYNVPAHAASHQFDGSDPVFLDSRQIIPGLVHPTSPMGLSVGLIGFNYNYGGWKVVSTISELPSLIDLKPVSTNAIVFVLVVIKLSTKQIEYIAGDEAFAFFGSDINIENNVPDIPNGYAPLAVIALSYNTTRITWNEIFDFRSGSIHTFSSVAPSTIGQIMYSVDGETFEPRLPLTSSEGFIITNEDGIIIVADEELSPFVPPPPDPFIITGGNRVGNLTTRSHTSDSDLIWEIDHGASVFCVSADIDGNVITGGEVAGGNTTRKYDIDGNIIWSVNHGNNVQGVATDSDKNIVTVGILITPEIRKYTSNGTALWTAVHGNQVLAVDVDSEDNVIIGGVRSAGTSFMSTRKYNSSGGLMWSLDHGSTVWAVAVDGDNNIITAGNQVGGATTRKYDASGMLIWSRDHGANLRGVAVDSNNNIVTVGFRAGDNMTTRKYDASGNLIWSRDHGATVEAVGISNNSDITTGGVRVSDITTRRYDSDGNLIWSIDHGATVFGIGAFR